MIMSIFFFIIWYCLTSLPHMDVRFYIIVLCYFKVILKSVLCLLWISNFLSNQRVSLRSSNQYIDLFTRGKSYAQLTSKKKFSSTPFFRHFIIFPFICICVHLILCMFVFFMLYSR